MPHNLLKLHKVNAFWSVFHKWDNRRWNSNLTNDHSEVRGWIPILWRGGARFTCKILLTLRQIDNKKGWRRCRTEPFWQVGRMKAFQTETSPSLVQVSAIQLVPDSSQSTGSNLDHQTSSRLPQSTGSNHDHKTSSRLPQSIDHSIDSRLPCSTGSRLSCSTDSRLPRSSGSRLPAFNWFQTPAFNWF